MMSVEKFLPQASPMVLLSGYDPTDAVGSVTAYVDVTREVPFFESELGGVPACVGVEYMAQAMALAVGLKRLSEGFSPQIGFLLGSRKFEAFVSVFADDTRYRVTAVNTYQDDSFGSFDCEVLAPDGSCAARATMTAFQPTGEMTPERMKEYE